MIFSKKDVGGLMHCTILTYLNSYVSKICISVTFNGLEEFNSNCYAKELHGHSEHAVQQCATRPKRWLQNLLEKSLTRGRIGRR